MGVTRTEPPYNASQDANKFPTNTFVSGTVGTADVNGTAEIVRGAADPLTGAQFVYNLAPAGSLSVGSLTAAEVAATNTFGTSGSIADTVTGTLVDYTAGTAFKLRGFSATGEGQGYFALQIGVGTTKYSGATSVANKIARIILPNPEAVASSTRVLLLVTNQNGDTRSFEGVIFGE